MAFLLLRLVANFASDRSGVAPYLSRRFGTAHTDTFPEPAD
jgi:hypothetical protein